MLSTPNKKRRTLTFADKRIKKPFQSKNNILSIYSRKSHWIEIANTLSVDTGITIDLPENSSAYLTTKFQGQKSQQITGPKNRGCG